MLALQPRPPPRGGEGEGPVCLPGWRPGLLSGSPGPGRHPHPPLPRTHLSLHPFPASAGKLEILPSPVSPEWPDFEERETERSRDAADGRKPGLWVPLSLGGLCQVGWTLISQRTLTCSGSA